MLISKELQFLHTFPSFINVLSLVPRAHHDRKTSILSVECPGNTVKHVEAWKLKKIKTSWLKIYSTLNMNCLTWLRHGCFHSIDKPYFSVDCHLLKPHIKRFEIWIIGLSIYKWAELVDLIESGQHACLFFRWKYFFMIPVQVVILLFTLYLNC